MCKFKGMVNAFGKNDQLSSTLFISTIKLDKIFVDIDRKYIFGANVVT